MKYLDMACSILADSEAALRERVANLESECARLRAEYRWSREISRGAIHRSHELTRELERSRATIREMRKAQREPSAQRMAA